ncbi:aminotransferase class I/II-fold pyridoxal phosphate-dependent enzyme [Oscillochloris sp. ZM17-4]|uniref:aminotransferase class I/II-fold pyridoxal phosphate-dependent enzyme n=1 Tax=Oscillochloris sp. ZM17-4 TaxID=2866714 RepID=UPI001C72B7BC|nr:aminotransferase class I/II-fold pyridoxal phosphate-dependent enzyme [Oscillochloris sp. ZM17-4]MBX0327842.1 aminotransferase class I/II-fold pyridoxal phosphate-dependent enzyme [Oscillochloris sp. ZM17-4]
MSPDRISRRVNAVPPSGIRRFFDIAATMPDVISLGVGEPDFITPADIRAAGQRSVDQTTAYTSNSGLKELRVALAAHLNARYGADYDAENELLMTVGVSEAMLGAALAVLNPGDEVLVPEPCFVAYPACVTFADAVPVYVPTSVADGFQVSAAALEAAITPRTRAILIGYPNNPTGAVMSRERMLEVAAVAERHDLLVISDEIYDRLVYGVEHVCFAALPGMRERTILLGGFSKAYAMTGWRLGWLAAPADITAAVRKVHQYAIMSAPTMSQYAGLEALRFGEPSVREMCAEYDRRRKVIVGGLNSIGLPTFEPQGAFYAFPSVAHLGLSSDQFCDRLLMEEQVAVVPGDAFGPSGAGHVRACYATSMDKIEEALERIERFVRRVS